MKIRIRNVVSTCFVFWNILVQVRGHGRLIEPPSRSSMWRFGFKTEPNYNDNELYCGGYMVQQTNGGKCGICGDNFKLPQPRPNEAGGKYGKGIIVRRYNVNQKIKVTVELTANHQGYFEFKLCPNNNPKKIASQECMDQYPLEIVGRQGSKYKLPNNNSGFFEVQLRLPSRLTCSQCVLQWRYTSGNNWGICNDGTYKVGCGPQETFMGCADVAVSGNYKVPVAPGEPKKPTTGWFMPMNTNAHSVTYNLRPRVSSWPKTPKVAPMPTSRTIKKTIDSQKRVKPAEKQAVVTLIPTNNTTKKIIDSKKQVKPAEKKLVPLRPANHPNKETIDSKKRVKPEEKQAVVTLKPTNHTNKEIIYYKKQVKPAEKQPVVFPNARSSTNKKTTYFVKQVKPAEKPHVVFSNAKSTTNRKTIDVKKRVEQAAKQPVLSPKPTNYTTDKTINSNNRVKPAKKQHVITSKPVIKEQVNDRSLQYSTWYR